MAASPEVRAAVLADIAAGMKIGEAAEKHGVPRGSITSWQRVARGLPAMNPPKPRDPDKPKYKIKYRQPPGPKPAPRPGLVETIGAELRSSLRRGVGGLSRYIALVGDRVPTEAADLAGFAQLPDMGQVAHAARALDILLMRMPDLMTFEEKTTPQTGTGEDALDRIAAAIEVTSPPALTTIEGGRTDTG